MANNNYYNNNNTYNNRSHHDKKKNPHHHSPKASSTGASSSGAFCPSSLEYSLILWGLPDADVKSSLQRHEELKTRKDEQAGGGGASSSARPVAPVLKDGPGNTASTKLDVLIRSIDEMANNPAPFELKASHKAAAASLLDLYTSMPLPALLEEKLRSELQCITELKPWESEDDDDESPRTKSKTHDKFHFADVWGNAPRKKKDELWEWAKPYDPALLNPFERFSSVEVPLRHHCYEWLGFKGVVPESGASLTPETYPSPPPSEFATYKCADRPCDNDEEGAGPEGLALEVLVAREIMRQKKRCLNCARCDIAPAGGASSAYCDFVCLTCESHFEMKVKNSKCIVGVNDETKSKCVKGGSFKQFKRQAAAFKARSKAWKEGAVPAPRHFLLVLDRESFRKEKGGRFRYNVYASSIKYVNPELSSSSFTEHVRVGTMMKLEKLPGAKSALELWMHAEGDEDEWFDEKGKERFKTMAERLLEEAFPPVEVALDAPDVVDDHDEDFVVVHDPLPVIVPPLLHTTKNDAEGLFFVMVPRSAERRREESDPCDEIELALARLAMCESAMKADRYAAQMDRRMIDKKCRRTARMMNL